MILHDFYFFYCGLCMSLHGRKIKRIMNWFGGTWLNLTFALCLALKILEAMAQTVVGAALLGAAGTAFLASPGSPGPVSQTAPSLRGTAPGNPGSAGSAGVAGTAALASLAGARWWMVGGSGEDVGGASA